MLSLNGLILIVNSCYLLARDLRIAFDKKYNRSYVDFLGAHLSLALLPFYIMTNSFGAFGENTPLQIYLNEM